MGFLWALALLWVLPAGLFALVFGGLALAAVPLALLMAWLMPAGWRRGVPPATLFMAAMLVAPVLLMSGLAVVALAGKPLEWTPVTWRAVEPARLPAETFRHMFPFRPGGGPGGGV